MNRPILEKGLNSETFRSFYYLKEELISFCEKYKLPTIGSKLEVTDRIAYFLETGKILTTPKNNRVKTHIYLITETSTIESNIVCSEIHRAFFIEKIGKTFSFNVIFQKWLKNNPGKTYQDAINAYYQILQENKKGKTVIDKQFEYNTYIRDFFKANKEYSLEQAIICWKYKKSLQGHNRYEHSDLSVL